MPVSGFFLLQKAEDFDDLNPFHDSMILIPFMLVDDQSLRLWMIKVYADGWPNSMRVDDQSLLCCFSFWLFPV